MSRSWSPHSNAQTGCSPCGQAKQPLPINARKTSLKRVSLFTGKAQSSPFPGSRTWISEFWDVWFIVHLSFHDFDKAEHFVGAVLLLTVLGRQIERVLCGEKLHDLETAFVEVKVDVPLFKIRGESFPHLGFGMQYLHCLSCAVSDAPAVDFRGGEQDIQLIVVGGLIDFQDHAAYFLPVADNAVGFAVRRIQTGFDGLA